ncbi:hypothetical protein MTO96_043768 [Rhipicephalus appendiculatus]
MLPAVAGVGSRRRSAKSFTVPEVLAASPETQSSVPPVITRPSEERREVSSESSTDGPALLRQASTHLPDDRFDSVTAFGSRLSFTATYPHQRRGRTCLTSLTSRRLVAVRRWWNFDLVASRHPP